MEGLKNEMKEQNFNKMINSNNNLNKKYNKNSKNFIISNETNINNNLNNRYNISDSEKLEDSKQNIEIVFSNDNEFEKNIINKQNDIMNKDIILIKKEKNINFENIKPTVNNKITNSYITDKEKSNINEYFSNDSEKKKIITQNSKGKNN